MISLIVYGRNDQHGYNSHRRVALSLNAMAEVLTSHDDEILFVDWNTPLGMPTLLEALEDTLTDKTLARLRILRVTPEAHHRVTKNQTRLPISEPHARNVAIRRARPENWILSTNTDMVFVPRSDRSLTDLVADLEGDAYCLPRFEIPEWLWEAVPRDDPAQMICLLQDWGERIGLDEVTLGHDWIRYDAPGDFQLIRRSLIERVHGFDEDMIHGWHVDSNLWKRIHNLTGQIGTLYPDIAGYHTNHNRTLTRLMAAQPTGNDLSDFVYEVEHTSLPDQAATWGLANVDVPEVPLRRVQPVPLLAASASRGPGQAGPLITSDTREQISVLDYDARHILPFALDPVIAETPRPSMGYVGLNSSTAGMLASAASALECPDGLLQGHDAAQRAGVVVLDLGIDAAARTEPMTRSEAEHLVALLRRTIDALRLRDPMPRILIINAISGIWDPWVRAQFNLSYGTFHTRIQPAELRDEIPEAPIDEHVLRSLRSLVFATRELAGVAIARRDGVTDVLDLGDGADYVGLAGGWESVDEVGAYVGGEKAVLRFRTTRPIVGNTRVAIDLACWSTAHGVPNDLMVDVLLDDEAVFSGPLAPIPQITTLRTTADLRGLVEHTLDIRARTTNGAPYRPRHSGGMQPWIRFGGLRLTTLTAPPIPPGEWVAVHPGSPVEDLLHGRWTATNPYGTWSLGDGYLEIPTAGAVEMELEVLGHAGRGDSHTRVLASGATSVTLDLPLISADCPGHLVIALPEPDADGKVRVEFIPVDPPAPSGEVVEVRAIRLRKGR